MTTIDPKRIIETHSSYESIIDKMNQMAKELYGEENLITPDDKNVHQMLAWQMRNEVHATQMEINLRKGIALAGEDLRKNRIMDLFRRFTLPPDYKMNFEIHTCSTISNLFSKEGPMLIERLSTESFDENGKPKTICFLDLGREAKSYHYGRSCYVMEEILYNRHSLFFKHGMLTHLTTSLDSNEVQARYGKELRACMKDMFNRVVLDDDTLNTT